MTLCDSFDYYQSGLCAEVVLLATNFAIALRLLFPEAKMEKANLERLDKQILAVEYQWSIYNREAQGELPPLTGKQEKTLL